MSRINGDLQCGRGIGNYTYAAGVLTVNWNYDTYTVNEPGTPTINNINLLGSSAPGVLPSDHNRFCAATIKLRAQQAFSLGNSGNIVARAGTRSVNSVVTLQYFPAAAKWYEV